jgi:hypothetical protein
MTEYRLVPVEPTPEMIEAACTFETWGWGFTRELDREAAAATYAAMLSAAPPASTMATAAWGNGVPWAGDDPRWDDVRLAWQARANECVYDHGRMDISDVEDCIGIALVRAFALTAPPAPTREAIEGALDHHLYVDESDGRVGVRGIRRAADAILALLGGQS